MVAAWWLLKSTHKSVQGLFDSLYEVRRAAATKKNNTTRGRPNGDAQNLLRAAIVFTSAGLDASVSALIEAAVPDLVAHHASARGKFHEFIDEQLAQRTVEDNIKSALKDADPRTQLIRLYIANKTRASFQGSSDLRKRACGVLGITNQ